MRIDGGIRNANANLRRFGTSGRKKTMAKAIAGVIEHNTTLANEVSEKIKQRFAEYEKEFGWKD